ncbi:2Fe-2S iron-sulfur cluster-binding protein [Temperatibacter marinus]|uniref:2Fe-2S iron-sulfur cluster-binding protein n=1 Tax=Temperatibacter marinus TaxID=1456591 RepID=A0AA52EGQ0_9PROT|nr:2Fe-2S iron-sulfur cluster-binding protein [Temperatibacter marinus]WND02209.1 2Fe-2S iron-sulfur cluster-binding protein [Temperatibacter marinus]
MKVLFLNHTGEFQAKWEGPSGLSLLTIAHECGLEMEGACEGNMACATCHVILAEADFKRVPMASDDEEEMLDFVPFLTSRSRLGCQVIVEECEDEMIVTLPKETTSFL